VLEPGIAECRFWRDFEEHDLRMGNPSEYHFKQMTEEERGRVEVELLKRLAAHPRSDDWVISALGSLHSTRAVPILRSLLFGRCSKTTRVAVAVALWRIRRDPDAVTCLVKILQNRSWLRRRLARSESFDVLDSSRMDATIALGEIDTVVSRRALEEALSDPNSFVRYHAKNGLAELNAAVSDSKEEGS
jgi:HEAT repeat protein